MASARLHLPATAELYDDLGPEYQSQEIALRGTLQSTREFTDTIVQILENKKSQVFEHVSFEHQVPEANIDAVEKLNKIIRNHNQACDSFGTTVTEARKKLANDMIADALEEFMNLNDIVSRTTDDAKAKEQEIHDLGG